MRNRTHIILRYLFVGFFILLAAGKIVYNMVDTTIVHAEDWNRLARKELDQTVSIKPVRGQLLAADGRVLAANRRLYTVRIDFTSEQFRFNAYRQSLPALADSLAKYHPLRSKEEWVERLNEPLNLASQQRTDSVKRYLRTWTLLMKLESNQVERLKTFPFFSIGNSAKTGMVVEATDDRIKPFGSLAERSIGIVAQDSSSSERHGRSGLEGSLDSLLYGVPGVAKKVAMTKSIGNWTDVPAIPGYDVTTTIDVDIQDIVDNELLKMLNENQADWGSAILMEVSTGNIRAISNFERDKKTGKYDVSINRIFLPYEPGSVMKPISMLIAMEDNIITNIANQSFDGHDGVWCYPSAKQPIKDSHPMRRVPVNLIIPNSSNIASAEMIMSRYRNNAEGFKQRLCDIGFGEYLNVGIKGENKPRFVKNPSNVDLSRMAYGYSIAVPPIYTITVYNAIANGGKMVRPRLYTKLERPDTVIEMPVTYVRERICSEEHARQLLKMMREVVTVPGATGYRVLHDCPIPIAGKTGTCRVQEGKGYNQQFFRVTFGGVFPYDKPMYSCIVVIEKPRVKYLGAAPASGQVLRNIALKLYARGMLDNSSDFTTDTHPGVEAEFSALPSGSAYTSLTDKIDIPLACQAVSPGNYGPGRVPDVSGLSLRQATSLIEDAGYNIKVCGDGSVESQTPLPGEAAPAGTEVVINLSTKRSQPPQEKKSKK